MPPLYPDKCRKVLRSLYLLKSSRVAFGAAVENGMKALVQKGDIKLPALGT